MNLAFLKFVSNGIKMIPAKFKINGNFSSHSFRIGKENRLLAQFPLEKVCQIIGLRYINRSVCSNVGK